MKYYLVSLSWEYTNINFHMWLDEMGNLDPFELFYIILLGFSVKICEFLFSYKFYDLALVLYALKIDLDGQQKAVF